MDAGASLLANLIWTGALGLAVGNYATSWVHRVPRGESSFTRHPYCSSCETPLQVRDLFPLLSYVMLKGRCRYCGAQIPPLYTWIELFTALIFMVGIANVGWSESYIFMLFGGTLALVLWGLEYRHQLVHDNTLLALGAVGVLYRTVSDGTGYDALYGAIIGATATLLWWRTHRTLKTADGDAVPVYVKLATVAGAWATASGMLLVMLPLWGICELVMHVVNRARGTVRLAPMTASFVLALVLVMLFPHWTTDLEAVALRWLSTWLTPS